MKSPFILPIVPGELSLREWLNLWVRFYKEHLAASESESSAITLLVNKTLEDRLIPKEEAGELNFLPIVVSQLSFGRLEKKIPCHVFLPSDQTFQHDRGRGEDGPRIVWMRNSLLPDIKYLGWTIRDILNRKEEGTAFVNMFERWVLEVMLYLMHSEFENYGVPKKLDFGTETFLAGTISSGGGYSTFRWEDYEGEWSDGKGHFMQKPPPDNKLTVMNGFFAPDEKRDMSSAGPREVVVVP